MKTVYVIKYLSIAAVVYLGVYMNPPKSDAPGFETASIFRTPMPTRPFLPAL